jgi:hypothetical protein
VATVKQLIYDLTTVYPHLRNSTENVSPAQFVEHVVIYYAWLLRIVELPIDDGIMLIEDPAPLRKEH